MEVCLKGTLLESQVARLLLVIATWRGWAMVKLRLRLWLRLMLVLLLVLMLLLKRL